MTSLDRNMLLNAIFFENTAFTCTATCDLIIRNIEPERNLNSIFFISIYNKLCGFVALSVSANVRKLGAVDP